MLQSGLNWPQSPQVKEHCLHWVSQSWVSPKCLQGGGRASGAPPEAYHTPAAHPPQLQLHDNYPFYGLESWIRFHLKQGSCCLKK